MWLMADQSEGFIADLSPVSCKEMCRNAADPEESLVVGFISINTRQQRALLPFSLNIFYSINTNDIQHTYIVNIQRIRMKA